MRRFDRQIRDRLASGISDFGESGLHKALQKSRQAFYESERADLLSDREFLFQQSRFIRKRWWALQGAVLAFLWLLLEWTQGGFHEQSCMGIAAALFGVLVLPELWRNRSACAMEIEGAAYYSLRQVYAARIFLFALVDLLLLCVFSGVMLSSGAVGLKELLAQFLLPYVVTCCICFKTLYSRRIESEMFAFFLCVIWSLAWLLIIQNEKIYGAVSLLAWLAMLAAASAYLGYCIRRGQKSCEDLLEVKTLWN